MFKIFSNINYYKDYYDKNFQINLDIQKIEEIEEEKEKETYYNNIAKISHFQEKLERSLGKLVKNLRLKNSYLFPETLALLPSKKFQHK